MAKKKTWTHEIVDTAHDVWLAGLGAMATAGDEGDKLFKKLVARGKKVEKQVGRPIGAVKGVKNRAGRTLESIQGSIDEGVSSALDRFGVPTRSEVASLSKKVDKLTRALNGGPTRRKKAAPKKPVRKTAKGKRPARKASRAAAG